MNVFVGILALLLVAFSVTTNAAGIYSPELTVASIRAQPDGSFDVRTEEVVNANCTEGGRFFRVKKGMHSMSAAGVKVALTVTLSAHAANKKILTYVDPSSLYCHAYMVQILN